MYFLLMMIFIAKVLSLSGGFPVLSLDAKSFVFFTLVIIAFFSTLVDYQQD